MKFMMILLLILLVGAGIAGSFLYMNGDLKIGSENSIDNVDKRSYETPEITTDLQDGSFVKIQFNVVTDSKKAQEEITKREFQIKNLLIKELAAMDKKDYKEGIGDLEKKLQEKMNEVMTEGEVTDVYTIDKILQ